MSRAGVVAAHPLAHGAPPRWAVEWGEDRYGAFATFELQGVRQRMRWVGPGSFLMGSPPTEAVRIDDETQHLVTMTRGYWIADTACTQRLWQAVMGSNPSHFQGKDASGELPVERVSREDVERFLQRARQEAGGRGLRLPTEAEWERACRAGTTTPFSYGATIDTEQVNYDGNHPYARSERGPYRQRTVPVGSLPANAWGLHEMHGNVWEWCSDYYGAYPAGDVVDPRGPEMGSHVVLRGGSWYAVALNCRAARRRAAHPGDSGRALGFRLARGQE